MNSLSIVERQVNNVLILDLNGKLRLGEDNIKFRKLFRSFVERGEKNILVNLSDVSTIDSSGLGELIAVYVTLRKSGGEIKLLHLNPKIRELMMLTKILTIFDSYESELEAVESFSPLALALENCEARPVV